MRRKEEGGRRKDAILHPSAFIFTSAPPCAPRVPPDHRGVSRSVSQFGEELPRNGVVERRLYLNLSRKWSFRAILYGAPPPRPTRLKALHARADAGCACGTCS